MPVTGYESSIAFQLCSSQYFNLHHKFIADHSINVTSLTIKRQIKLSNILLLQRSKSVRHKDQNNVVLERAKHNFLLCPIPLSCLVTIKICLNQCCHLLIGMDVSPRVFPVLLEALEYFHNMLWERRRLALAYTA